MSAARARITNAVALRTVPINIDVSSVSGLTRLSELATVGINVAAPRINKRVRSRVCCRQNVSPPATSQQPTRIPGVNVNQVNTKRSTPRSRPAATNSNPAPRLPRILADNTVHKAISSTKTRAVTNRHWPSPTSPTIHVGMAIPAAAPREQPKRKIASERSSVSCVVARSLMSAANQVRPRRQCRRERWGRAERGIEGPCFRTRRN